MKVNAPSIAADGRHRYAVRVYYEDTDAGGVVYHASYLRFAERARTEALRDAGIPHAELLERFTLMFVVRRIEVDYLRPAVVDDSLTVVTEPLAVGGASVTLRQDVRGPRGTCAALTVRLACVKPGVVQGEAHGNTHGNAHGNARPGRLPQRWRTVLTALCQAATGQAATGNTDGRAPEDRDGDRG